MLRLFLFFIALLPILNASADESVRVVTTTNSLGMLVNEIAQPLVEQRQLELKVLASPGRDVHYLDARPSFMAAVRRADLLIDTGAGLEEGWLPAITANAANPDINSGQPGRLSLATSLQLRPSITTTGPHAGHVHRHGNPHFNIDPLRMAKAARLVARRLGHFFPDQKALLIKRSYHLEQELKQTAEYLSEQLVPGQRFIAYHEDVDYLEAWLPVQNIGYLEPLPGLPPTSKHLRELVEKHQQQESARVLYARFNPDQGARFLNERLGWPTYAVPLEPETPDWNGYKELLQAWANAFEQKS
ncbi:metal ABC transporter substrate-binding protein [Oceanospirillum sp.]|uniref:metal ABC transporter substrate-binding protein n=1 Tax=Oceanospirillum sp. TaxID=2021254 RepID=UPI003A9411C2